MATGGWWWRYNGFLLAPAFVVMPRGVSVNVVAKAAEQANNKNESADRIKIV